MTIHIPGDSPELQSPKKTAVPTTASNETRLDEFVHPTSLIVSANRFAALDSAADTHLGRDSNSEVKDNELATHEKCQDPELHQGGRFTALDGAADSHLPHNPNNEDKGSTPAANTESLNEKLHRELIECQEKEWRGRKAFEREKAEYQVADCESKERQRSFQERKNHREEPGQTMESEHLKAEEPRCDSAVNDCVGLPTVESSGELLEPSTSDIYSLPLRSEENAPELCHGRLFKTSPRGAKMILNPLNAEFDRRTPLSNSTNVAHRVMEQTTQPEDIGKGLLADLVANCTPCPNTSTPTSPSTAQEQDDDRPVQPGKASAMSGPDDVEISPKDKVPSPSPHLFDGSRQEISDTLLNIVEKRTPETHTTGRVRKKSKGVVRNIMPTDPCRYPDANDVQNDSVNGEAEATVAQVGGVVGEEDELDAVCLDGSGPRVEIDNVLNRMLEVNRQISALRQHLGAENKYNRPLYQWDKYTAYSKLRLATAELETTARHLKLVGDRARMTLLPQEYVVSYLDRVLKLSTSTSKSVVFALNIMSVRSATCMDEIMNSNLDEVGRDAAKTVIAGEVGELLKHSTAATNSVYAATDLLRTSLHPETYGAIDQYAKPREHIKRGSWKYGLLLGLSLFSIGLASSRQLGHLLPADWIPSDRVFGTHIPNGYALVDIASLQSVLRSTINNITEMNMVDTRVTSARLEHLEETYETTEQRIDNIWDALGPPGSDGRYDFGPHTYRLNEDAVRDIQQFREEFKTQIDRVNYEIAHLDKIHKEIVDIRRHVHRVDLRLTKRVDHLQQGRT